MEVQSLSIVVPTKGCINNCKFCVSRMHDNDYACTFNKDNLVKRIKYAVINKVTTCIITGTGEALQNINFLNMLAEIFEEMNHPFPSVELQTSGVLLQHYHEFNVEPFKGTGEYDNIKLLQKLKVNTISLSISDIWDDKNNMDIIGVHENLRFNIYEIIQFLKGYNFNIRLSLNMTNAYDNIFPKTIINLVKSFGADQVTFRKLYSSNDGSSQSKWVNEYKCSEETFEDIIDYIVKDGKYLYTLPFGAKVYSIKGISTVIDDDCMSVSGNTSLKYLIIREDGKLYCRWDDKGSLIF